MNCSGKYPHHTVVVKLVKWLCDKGSFKFKSSNATEKIIKKLISKKTKYDYNYVSISIKALGEKSLNSRALLEACLNARHSH